MVTRPNSADTPYSTSAPTQISRPRRTTGAISVARSTAASGKKIDTSPTKVSNSAPARPEKPLETVPAKR